MKVSEFLILTQHHRCPNSVDIEIAGLNGGLYPTIEIIDSSFEDFVEMEQEIKHPEHRPLQTDQPLPPQRDIFTLRIN